MPSETRYARKGIYKTETDQSEFHQASGTLQLWSSPRTLGLSLIMTHHVGAAF